MSRSFVPVVAEQSLEQVCARLVRRCSVSGDGRSGRVRLQLAQGALEGSVLHLAYDGLSGELTLDVELAENGDGNAARRALDAIEERFARRGITVRVAEVETR